MQPARLLQPLRASRPMAADPASMRRAGLCAAVAAACAISVAGCAAPQTARPDLDDKRIKEESKLQRELALAEIVKMRDRLHSLSYEVATGGAAVCGDDIAWIGGFTVGSWAAYPEHLRETVQERYGLEKGEYQVASLAPDSPAALAGLQQFDKLIELNGRSFDQPPESKPDGEQNILAIEREGERIELKYAAVRACGFPVQLVFDPALNAFADGDSIAIMSGLMRALPDDQEIQAIIAHEYAHNFLGHIDAKMQNAILGAILDAAIIVGTGIDPVTRAYTSRAFSVDFEAEADYVSLYMLANAGIEIGGIPDLWRKMTLLNPTVDVSRNKSLLNTHPANPERFVALEQTIAEIKAKIAAGEELKPNFGS